MRTVNPENMLHAFATITITITVTITEAVAVTITTTTTKNGRRRDEEKNTSTLFDVGSRMLSLLSKSPKGTLGSLIISLPFDNIWELTADNTRVTKSTTFSTFSHQYLHIQTHAKTHMKGVAGGLEFVCAVLEDHRNNIQTK